MTTLSSNDNLELVIVLNIKYMPELYRSRVVSLKALLTELSESMDKFANREDLGEFGDKYFSMLILDINKIEKEILELIETYR